MKMIVTGATGFIGTALCEELLKNGHEVVAVVREGSTKRDKLCFESEKARRLQVVECALDCLSELSVVVGKADIFYHLAWNGSAGAEREDFDKQYTNVGYTAEAIRAAAGCGCHKFVGAGSQAEYGVVHGIAREEETVPNPFMMYGAAKVAACQMGRVLAKQLGISFVWPRIYSVYGVGENPGTLVHYLIESLQKGEVPQLSPCENMWNFMYITDCARALRILGETRETEGIYNVASEDTRPLREFVEEIRDIVAPAAELEFGAKKSDPKRTFWLEPDVGRVSRIWNDKKLSFAEGIEKTTDRDKVRKGK